MSVRSLFVPHEGLETNIYIALRKQSSFLIRGCWMGKLNHCCRLCLANSANGTHFFSALI